MLLYIYNKAYICTIYTIGIYLPGIKCADLKYIVWWVLTNVYAHVSFTQSKIQSTSITPEISLLSLSSQFPPPLPEALTVWFFSPWINLACHWNSYKWNNAVCTLLCLAFFTYCVYHGCFVLLSSILLHTYTRLFIFLLVNGHLDCLFFHLLWLKLP